MAFSTDYDEHPPEARSISLSSGFVFSAPGQQPHPQPNPSTAVRELLKEGPDTVPARYTQMASQERLCAPEAEQEVCAALLRTDENNFKDMVLLVETFRVDDFFIPAFRNIAQLSVEALGRGELPSFSGVMAAARESQIDVGGIETLNDLAENPALRFVSPTKLSQACGIITDLGNRRRIRQELQAHISALERQDAATTLVALHDSVASLTSNLERNDDGPVHIWQVVEPVLEGLVAPDDTKPTNVVATGFGPLDERTSGGLRDGELIYIGGRPSMGKTALSLNIARNISVDQSHGRPVLYFSLEMSKEALGMRLLAAESLVSLKRMRSLDLNESHLHDILDVAHLYRKPGEYIREGTEDSDTPEYFHVDGSNLYIIDTPGQSLEDIRATSRRFARSVGRPIIVIDYLQFISPSRGVRNEDPGRFVAGVSRGLKNLAKELDCPVIALTQLNRSLEQRASKRPILSDLRESGNLEQDADQIWFVYRDVIYNPDTPYPDAAELIIAKQRDGEIGIIPMTYQGEIVRFVMRSAEY